MQRSYSGLSYLRCRLRLGIDQIRLSVGVCGHDSPTFFVFSPYHTPQRTGCLRHLNPTSLFPSGAYCTVACILSPLLLSFYFARWAYHCSHYPQSLADVSVLHKDFVLSHPLIATIRANQPPGYFSYYTHLIFLSGSGTSLPTLPSITHAVEPSAFRLTAGSLEVVGYWVAPVFLFCLAWTILLPYWTLRKGLYGVPGLCKFIIDATDLSRH